MSLAFTDAKLSCEIAKMSFCVLAKNLSLSATSHKLARSFGYRLTDDVTHTGV